MWKIVQEEHKTHWEADALYNTLRRQIVRRNLYITVTQITKQCKLFLHNKPQTTSKPNLRAIGKGNVPGQQWQIDYSELPRKGRTHTFQY